MFYAVFLNVDTQSKYEKQVKCWTNLSHGGWFWVDPSSWWQQSLSHPAFTFLRDDPEQLISTLQLLRLPLCKPPSGGGALLEWRNRVGDRAARPVDCHALLL